MSKQIEIRNNQNEKKIINIPKNFEQLKKKCKELFGLSTQQMKKLVLKYHDPDDHEDSEDSMICLDDACDYGNFLQEKMNHKLYIIANYQIQAKQAKQNDSFSKINSGNHIKDEKTKDSKNDVGGILKKTPENESKDNSKILNESKPGMNDEQGNIKKELNNLEMRLIERIDASKADIMKMITQVLTSQEEIIKIQKEANDTTKNTKNEASINISHEGIDCIECQELDIKGNRYKCSTCKDYNVCEDCFSKTKHTHLFVVIKNPDHIKKEKEEENNQNKIKNNYPEEPSNNNQKKIKNYYPENATPHKKQMKLTKKINYFYKEDDKDKDENSEENDNNNITEDNYIQKNNEKGMNRCYCCANINYENINYTNTQREWDNKQNIKSNYRTNMRNPGDQVYKQNNMDNYNSERQVYKQNNMDNYNTERQVYKQDNMDNYNIDTQMNYNNKYIEISNNNMNNDIKTKEEPCNEKKKIYSPKDINADKRLTEIDEKNEYTIFDEIKSNYFGPSKNESVGYDLESIPNYNSEDIKKDIALNNKNKEEYEDVNSPKDEKFESNEWKENEKTPEDDNDYEELLKKFDELYSCNELESKELRISLLKATKGDFDKAFDLLTN